MTWLVFIKFLRSPLARYIGIAAAILALLGGVYSCGHHNGVRREQSAQAAREASARKAVAKIETRAAAITTDVAVKSATHLDAIHTVTLTIIKEVPKYVTVKADAQCTVPAGFVQLHDAAAAGHLPSVSSATPGANDAPSGIALSAVAVTVAENYGACNVEISRLTDLQAWVRREWAAHH